MNAAGFLLVYVVSAAVLAMWLHVRWPFVPSLKMLGAHVAAAMIVLTVAGHGRPLAVVALTFAGLVYAFLVAVWGMEIVRSAAGMGR